MSVYSGPGLINDGLVFYYDMGNTDKSWKGKPTTNIRPNQTLVAHGGNTPTINNSYNITINGSSGWSSITSSGSNSNYRLAQFSYNSLTLGLDYTFSIELYNPGPNALNVFIDGSNGYAQTVIPVGYSRWEYTINRPSAGSQAIFFGAQSAQANATYNPPRTIYYKNYQVEQNSFATPFVDGTRSNTQALLDLTGSKTIDLINTTDSTFNSDSNALTLDGNNQYIYANGGNFWNAWSPNGVNGNSSMSIEVVFNSTDTSGLIISRPWNGSGQYNYRMGAGSIVLHIGSSSTSIGYGNVCTGDTVHMVYWMNATQYGVYKNGQTHISATNHGLSGSGGSYGTNDFGTLFGSLYPYGEGWSGNTGYSIAGKYYQAKIYNRVLTADEVRQNFNAHRARYGI